MTYPYLRVLLRIPTVPDTAGPTISMCTLARRDGKPFEITLGVTSSGMKGGSSMLDRIHTLDSVVERAILLKIAFGESVSHHTSNHTPL
jgi:hypothetical protein